MPRIKYTKENEGLSLKQRAFVDETIRTRDPTVAAREVYDISGRNARTTATSIASENLTKPLIISAIEKRLKEKRLFFGDVVKSFKRNIVQDQDLNVSQHAIDSYMKITGNWQDNNNAKTQTQVAIIIDR